MFHAGREVSLPVYILEVVTVKFKKLREFLDAIPERVGVPGTDCIIYHHRKEVFRHQSGYADPETKKPMTPDLLYNMYSATKPVTCTAALQLYEKGAFLLTDPLGEYIPEFKTMYVKENGLARQAKNPILVRDLFMMTAGFDYDIRRSAIINAKKESDHRCPTLETIRAFAKESLIFEPGTNWEYSLCHDVLGALIEVLSGMSLEDYCRKNLFDPLQMNDTSYFMDEEKEKRLAPMFMFSDEKGCAEKISGVNIFRFGSEYASGGAGLVSSVDDYIRFADCLACGGRTPSGERILGKRTIDLMRKNHLTGATYDDFREYAKIHMPGYGYGLGVRTMQDVIAGGSNGPVGEFGWGGATGNYVLIDPENELAVYYAQHMHNSKEPIIHRRIRNIVYGCIE